MNPKPSLGGNVLKWLFILLTFTAAHADDFKPEPGFTSLFNGTDLTGWGYRTNNFDGKTESNDGQFTVKDGMLVANATSPQVEQTLWTTREFPRDFHLRLEFRASTNADSGVFIRGVQLQVRDYLIAGPYTDLKKYKPQDWNELHITVKKGVARCTCNGEVVEEALIVPSTGAIGLEANRGQMEFRRIRLIGPPQAPAVLRLAPPSATNP